MTSDLSFPTTPDKLPKLGSAERAALGREHWAERVAGLDDTKLAGFARDLIQDPDGRRLLDAVFANSDFLTHCMLSDMGFLARLLKHGPEAEVRHVFRGLEEDLSRETDRAQLMSGLRIARRRMALTVGLADMTGLWPLEKVTGALSDFADAALEAALCHLLWTLAGRGDLVLADPQEPTRDCGYVVLAMGKHGARELNYSSDIDLIVIYDPEKIDYRGSRSPQEALVRLTRDQVTLLEERTREGYGDRE